MGAEEFLITAEGILRAAADPPLHPFAVTATEPCKFTGFAQLRMLMASTRERTHLGRTQKFFQRSFAEIADQIFIHAVEITGIDTDVGFHNDLRAAASVDAAGTALPGNWHTTG